MSRSSMRWRSGARSPLASRSTSRPRCPSPAAWNHSSTCVVAGIMAAAALTSHTVTREELVAMATRVEGHPDNVAPAILGAAVCSFTPDGHLPRCLRYNVSERLRFVTVIPPYEVHTSDARKVVPQEVPLSTAVWQMGRVAGLTRGLENGLRLAHRGRQRRPTAGALPPRPHPGLRRHPRDLPCGRSEDDVDLWLRLDSHGRYGRHDRGEVPAGSPQGTLPRVRDAHPYLRYLRRTDRIPVVTNSPKATPAQSSATSESCPERPGTKR